MEMLSKREENCANGASIFKNLILNNASNNNKRSNEGFLSEKQDSGKHIKLNEYTFDKPREVNCNFADTGETLLLRNIPASFAQLNAKKPSNLISKNKPLVVETDHEDISNININQNDNENSIEMKAGNETEIEVVNTINVWDNVSNENIKNGNKKDPIKIKDKDFKVTQKPIKEYQEKNGKKNYYYYENVDRKQQAGYHKKSEWNMVGKRNTYNYNKDEYYSKGYEKRYKTIVIGKSQNFENLATSKNVKEMKLFPVYIGRIKHSIDDEMICDLLKDLNLNYTNFVKLEVQHNKFKSFKFNVPYTQVNKIFDDKLWPKGIAISKFVSNKYEKINEIYKEKSILNNE
jgi:hypothetical protein